MFYYAIQIIELKFEKNRLVQLRDTHVDVLKREENENIEIQKNKMNSELDYKRKLLDTINKEIENINVKILSCKKLFVEAACVNVRLESCTESMK